MHDKIRQENIRHSREENTNPGGYEENGEEQRQVKATTFCQQGQWIKLEGVRQRKITMEQAVENKDAEYQVPSEECFGCSTHTN